MAAKRKYHYIAVVSWGKMRHVAGECYAHECEELHDTILAETQSNHNLRTWGGPIPKVSIYKLHSESSVKRKRG